MVNYIDKQKIFLYSILLSMIIFSVKSKLRLKMYTTFYEFLPDASVMHYVWQRAGKCEV